MAKPWEEDWGTQAAATTPTTPPWEIDWDVESNLPPWEQNWGQGSPAPIISAPEVTSPYEGVEGIPIPPQFLRPDLDVGNIRETVVELPKREETTEVAVEREKPARRSLYRNVPKREETTEVAVEREKPARRSLYRNVPIRTPEDRAPVVTQEQPPVVPAPVIAQETPPVVPAPVIAQESGPKDANIVLLDEMLDAEGITDPAKRAFMQAIYEQESSSGTDPDIWEEGGGYAESANIGDMQMSAIARRELERLGLADEGELDLNTREGNIRGGIRYALLGLEKAGGDPALGATFYYGGYGGLEAARSGEPRFDADRPDMPSTLEYGAEVAAMTSGIVSSLGGLAAQAQPAEEPEKRSDFIDASKGTWNLLTNVAPKTLGLFNEALVAEGYTERAEGYAAVDQGLSDKELKEKFGDSALAVDRGGRGEVGWLKLYQLATPERRAQLMADHHAGVENVTQRILGKIPALTAAQQKGEQYAPRVAGVTDIKEWGDFVDWLQYNVTAGAIQLAPVMGAAFVAGPVGAGVVGTALATSEAISARLEFINEVVKDLSVEDQAKAITKYLQDTQDTTAMVGLVSGLLDLSGPVYSIVRRNVVKELGEEVVERTLKEVAKQSAIRGAGEVGQEFITGGAQELVQEIGELAEGEQGQGATLFSVENLKRILNAAAAEAAGSFGVSTAGFVASTGVAAIQNKTAANNTELQAAVQTEIVRLRELPENADKTDAQIEALAVEGIVQNAPDVLAKVIAKEEIKEALPDLSDAEVDRLAELSPEQRHVEVLTQINNAEVATEVAALEADPANAGKTPAEIDALVTTRASELDILEAAAMLVQDDGAIDGAAVDLATAELETEQDIIWKEAMEAPVPWEKPPPPPAVEPAVDRAEAALETTETETETETETVAPLSGLTPQLEQTIADLADEFVDDGGTSLDDTATANRKVIADQWGEEAAVYYDALVKEGEFIPDDVEPATAPVAPPVDSGESSFDDFSEDAGDGRGAAAAAATRLQQEQSGEPLQPKGKQGRPPGTPLTPEEKAADKRNQTAESARLGRQGEKGLKALNKSPDSVWGSRNTPTQEEYNTVTQRLADAKELMDAGVASQDAIAQQAADRTQLNVWDQNLKAQETNLSNERIDAIVNALKAINNVSYKTKPAVMRKAQEALSNPSITEAELQRAQEIIKEEEQASNARAVEISESTNSEPNPAILDAPDLMSIVDSIIANGNQFEKALMRLIKPFLKNTQLVIVNNENTDVPASLAADFKGARGLYVDSTNTIYLNAVGGTNNTVALHEALHAATVHVLASVVNNPKAASPKLRIIVEEIKQLMAVAADKYEMDKNAGRTTLAMDKLAGEDISVFTDIKEFVAYGLSQPELQEFLSTVDATLTWRLGTLRNGLSKFLDLVRQIFKVPDKYYSAFIALADLTEKLLIESALYERIPSSDIAKANKVGRKATQVAKKVAESNLANLPAAIDEQAKVMQNGDKAASLLDNVSHTRSKISPRRMRYIVNAMGTRTILKQKGSEIKNLHAMNDIVNQIIQYKHAFLKNVARETKKWEQFNSKFKEGAIILADVMHLATLHQFDPSRHKDMATALLNDKTLNDLRAKYKTVSNDVTASRQRVSAAKGQVTRRENIIKEVYEGATVNAVLVGGWNRLQEKDNGGQEGVRIYKMAHQTYKDNLAEFQTLTLQEIKNRKLKPENEKALIEKMEEMFAASGNLEVYFPLMRNGDYYIAIKRAGKGLNGPERRIFRTFKTMQERDDYAERKVQELWGGTSTVDQLMVDRIIEKGNTTAPNNKNAKLFSSGKLLNDIFELLDATGSGQPQGGIDVKEIAAIKDSVYQMYIETLPSADLRRGAIHRKGIAGFSNDVLRNFVTSQINRANQLARLKYNGALLRATENAYAELEGSVWQERNKVWVEVFEARTQSLINPDPDTISSLITSFGTSAVFVFMLSAPASALVNMTQLHIVGTSILERDFGYLRTQAMQKRYALTMFNKFGTGTSVINADGSVTIETGQPSMRKSAYFANNPDREFLEQAYDYADSLNTFMDTFAGDLTDRSKISIADAIDPNASVGRKLAVKGEKVMDIALNISSLLFHHGERVTREVMFMSAFELSFAKLKREGMSPEDAVGPASRQAHDLMVEALFDYSFQNKPEWMKNWRLTAQFFTYASSMINLLTRNVIGMAMGLPDGRTRRDAATVIFGILGRTFLYSGIAGLGLGLISFPQIMAMMTWARDKMRPDFEDADEEEKEFWYNGVQNDMGNPFSAVDLEFWFRYTFLPEYFGYGSTLATFLDLTEEQADLVVRGIEMGPISALTDVNIGPRVSLAQLIFRSDELKRDTAQARAEGYFFTIAGPAGGLGVSLLEGSTELQEAKTSMDLNKATQKLVPAIVRGSLKAYANKMEGWIPPGEFIAREGYDQAYYTWQKVLAQMIGFSGTEQTQTREREYQFNQQVYDRREDRNEVFRELRDSMVSQQFAAEEKTAAEEVLDRGVGPAFDEFKANRAIAKQEAAVMRVNAAVRRKEQFNARFPAYEITVEGMQTAYDAALAKARSANRGILLDLKSDPSEAEIMKRD